MVLVLHCSMAPRVSPGPTFAQLHSPQSIRAANLPTCRACWLWLEIAQNERCRAAQSALPAETGIFAARRRKVEEIAATGIDRRRLPRRRPGLRLPAFLTRGRGVSSAMQRLPKEAAGRG